MTRNYTTPNLTSAQRANLETLYRESPKTEESLPMDMLRFAYDDVEVAHVPTCGTIACLAGRGPMCGVEPMVGERWTGYCDRAFGASDDRLWMWLFSDYWRDRDNTLSGARARTRILLDKGIPDDWAEQLSGETALEYGDA